MTEGVGYSDPTGMQRKAADAEDGMGEDIHEAVPEHYTLVAAEA